MKNYTIKIVIIEYKWKIFEYVKKNYNTIEKDQMLQRLICHIIHVHILTISCINAEIVFNSLFFLSSLIVFESCVVYNPRKESFECL